MARLRRWLVRAVALCVGLVFLLVAAVYALRSTRLVWSPVEDLGVKALVKQLEVPCEIGRLSGDPLRDIHLERLTIGPDGSSPTGSLIAVDQVTVKHRVLAVLRRKPLAETVDAVEAKGLRAFLHRTADGKLNLVELIPKPKEPKKPPPRFRGKVTITDVELHYRDDALGPAAERPFRKRVLLPSIVADFAAFPTVKFDVSGGCPDGTLKSIHVNGTADIETKAVQAVLTLAGIDLPVWTKLAPLPDGFLVEEGAATVSVTADLTNEAKGRTVNYDTDVSLKQFALLVPPGGLSVAGTDLHLDARGGVSLPASDEKRDTAPALGEADTTKKPAPPLTCFATLTSRMDHVGQVLLTADVDTERNSILGSLRAPAVDCRHWLDALGANGAVRLTAGTVGLDTNFEVGLAGEAPRVDLAGSVRLSGGQLDPPALSRPLAGLAGTVSYDVGIALGDKPVAAGEATVFGQARDVPHYRLACRFDTGRATADGRLRLAGVDVPGIVSLVGGTDAFRPAAGRVGLDLSFGARGLTTTPAATYDGRVSLAALTGEAKGLAGPLPELNADLRVDGGARLGRTPEVTARVVSLAPVRGLGGLLVEADYGPAGANVEIDADRIEAPLWAALFLPKDGPSVHRGLLTTHAKLSAGKELHYEATGAIRDLAVQLPMTGKPIVQVAGDYEVKPDFAKLSEATALLGESRLVVDGTVSDFAKPQLDVNVRGEHLVVDELLRLAPENEALAKLAVVGTGASTLKVTGGPPALNVSGEVRFGDLRAEHEDYGIVRLKPFPVQLALAGLPGDDATLDVRVEELQADVTELDREAMGAAGEHVSIPDLVGASVHLSGPTKTPKIEASVSVPMVRVGDGQLTRIAADLEYADGQLRLANAIVHAGEGYVTAEGTVGNAEDNSYLDVRGTLKQFSLALAKPWIEEKGLTAAGLVSGTFALAGPPKALRVTSKLDVTGTEVTQVADADTGAERRFRMKSGEADVGLTLTAGEDATTVSGTAGLELTGLAAELPQKEAGKVTPLEVERVQTTLRLAPENLSSDRIEVAMAGASIALTDFRYGLKEGVLSAQTDVSGLALASLSALTGREDLSGTASFAGAVGLADSKPSADGELNVRQLKLADSPECQVSAKAALTWPEVRLARARVDALGCSVEAQGTVRLPEGDDEAGELDLQVKGGGPLDELAKTYVPEGLPLTGKLALGASVSGTLKAPTATASVSVVDGTAKGIPVDRLEVMGAWEGDSGRLDSLLLDAGGAKVRASGTLEEKSRLAASFRLDPVPLELALRAAELKGAAAGNVTLWGEVGGTLEEPTVTAQLKSEGLSLNGESLGALTAKAAYRDDAVALDPFTWELPHGAVRATGSLPVVSPKSGEDQPPAAPMDCRVTWGDLELDGLRRLGEMVSGLLKENDRPIAGLDGALAYLEELEDRPTGALAGGVMLTGSLAEPVARDARLQFTDGMIGEEPIPELDLLGGYDGGTVTCDHVRARLGDMLVEVKGTAELEGDAALQLRIANLPLSLANPWLPPKQADPETTDEAAQTTAQSPAAKEKVSKLQIGGLVNLQAQVTGPTKAPHVEGTVTVLDLAAQNAVLERLHLGRFVLEEGAFVIEPESLVLTQDEQSLLIGCRIPVSYQAPHYDKTKPFEAAVRVANGDLRLLRHFAPTAPKMLGPWTADLTAGGTFERPEVRGRVALEGVNIALPGMESRVHGLAGEILFEPGRRITVKDLGAQLAVAPIDAPLPPEERRQSLRLSGNVQLTDEGLKNPLANAFDLLLELSKLELKVVDTSTFTDVDSRVSLKTRPADGREVVALENLSLRAEKGSGPLKANGTLVLPADLDAPDGLLNACDIELTAAAKNLTVTRAPFGPLTLDTNMRFANAPGQQSVPALSGEVTVHDTELTAPKRVKAPTERAAPPAFPALNLIVALGDRVELVHPLIRAPLSGRITVSGTPADPVVEGKVSAREGTVRLPRAKAQLRQVDVRVVVRKDEFSEQLAPQVWVTALATTQVDNYAIEIKMDGPLDLQDTGESQFDLRVSSAPPLPQDQIYAMLIGLRRGEGGEGAPVDLKQAFQSKVVGMVKTQASGMVTRELKEALGLEKLDLLWGEEGLSEVAFKKRLGSLSLGMRKGLGRSALDQAFQVEYRFSRSLSTEYEQDEDQTTHLRFKYVIDFDT